MEFLTDLISWITLYVMAIQMEAIIALMIYIEWSDDSHWHWSDRKVNIGGACGGGGGGGQHMFNDKNISKFRAF